MLIHPSRRLAAAQPAILALCRATGRVIPGISTGTWPCRSVPRWTRAPNGLV